MVEFIAFSNMRCAYAENEQGGIDSRNMQKINDICNAVGDCNFIASLGNTISGSSEKSLEHLNNILASFDQAASVHALMGADDAVISKREFIDIAGCSMRYNAFDVNNYRCIFLDTLTGNNEDLYEVNASAGFAIDDEQLAWLSRLLGRSHRTAIVFSHAPIAVSEDADKGLLISGSEKLRELFEKSGKVALVVSGCANKSDCVISNNVPYINLAPMDVGEETSFAKISVSSKSVEIMGFGKQKSYSISKHSSKGEKTKKRFSLRSFFKKFS